MLLIRKQNYWMYGQEETFCKNLTSIPSSWFYEEQLNCLLNGGNCFRWRWPDLGVTPDLCKMGIQGEHWQLDKEVGIQLLFSYSLVSMDIKKRVKHIFEE